MSEQREWDVFIVEKRRRRQQVRVVGGVAGGPERDVIDRRSENHHQTAD